MLKYSNKYMVNIPTHIMWGTELMRWLFEYATLIVEKNFRARAKLCLARL